jgi:hypothetical protein
LTDQSGKGNTYRCDGEGVGGLVEEHKGVAASKERQTRARGDALQQQCPSVTRERRPPAGRGSVTPAANLARRRRGSTDEEKKVKG